MPEGRCMKCKKQVMIKDPKDTTINSRGGELAAVHGVCPTCGTKVFRIIGKKK
jgi:DNA-directed RNA polymerase subunit RPC12/RpoP